MVRELNPGVETITYDVADLFAYVDKLPALALLVAERSGGYSTLDREWIKKRALELLQRQAGGRR